MALRVQKRASQIGVTQAGEIDSRTLGGTFVVTEENWAQISASSDPMLVLEAEETDDFETVWRVVEVRAD
jgi:hypothetical protein